MADLITIEEMAAITPEEIKQRTLGRFTTDLQTREGSFTNDVISAMALELCNCYHSIAALLPMFYLDASSGEYIDQQASAVAITRKTGTRASCSITFTGTDGATVPAGAAYYTQTGLAYTLNAAVTLTAGTATGTLTAENVGDVYNISAGEIVSALNNYSGVTGYANGAATGGTDAETDTGLLSRYLNQMRRAPTSGNPYQYQQWAESVDGVGAARIVSKWNGPGTVKVILASGDMATVDETVRAATAAYIETQRPVGPAVTVVSAAAHNLAVAATVTIDGTTTLSIVQVLLQAAIESYLSQLVSTAFADTVDLDFDTMAGKTYTVSYNRISYLLLSIPGVKDFSLLTVGGGTANITIAADEVPVLTGVTVS